METLDSLDSRYSTCVTKANPRSGWNNRGQHAKLAIVAHGNQAVEQARDMHGLVDNGEGAGYQRPVKIHNIYTNCPMNLHITPTLAMAMEWAEVGNEKTWYSGAAFNDAIRNGVAKGAFSLIGSTFSDHVIKYYPDAFNAANAALAEDTLNAIYGNGSNVVSTNAQLIWHNSIEQDTYNSSNGQTGKMDGTKGDIIVGTILHTNGQHKDEGSHKHVA